MTNKITPQTEEETSSGLSLYQIKSRFSGKILFELKTTSLKYCVEATVMAGVSLNGAALDGAELDGAALNGAALDGAALKWASFDGASLKWASFDGAFFDFKNEKIKIKKTPICISNLRYEIIIFDSHMKIGCQFHSISEWFSFDEKTIEDMDDTALELWEQNKDWLKAVCTANGRGR